MPPGMAARSAEAPRTPLAAGVRRAGEGVPVQAWRGANCPPTKQSPRCGEAAGRRPSRCLPAKACEIFFVSRE